MTTPAGPKPRIGTNPRASAFPGIELTDETDLDLEAASGEHYNDAALYDFEYRRRRVDVTFYRDLARQRLGAGGRVLELGCGSGRVTLPLARDGHTVVGVDRSLPMLAQASRRVARLPIAARRRVSLVCADVRRLPLAGRFPLVLMAFNAFEHMYTLLDAAECLAAVHRLVAPGGVFAFDVQNPDLAWLCRDPDKHWARTRFRHPLTRELLEYTTNHVYDPISQIAFIHFYYAPIVDGQARRPRIVRLAQRKFFPAELDGMLGANGFSIEERFGGFGLEPLVGSSACQIMVCRAV